MPVANETYKLIGTDDWQLIASVGNVIVTTSSPFEWAMTAGNQAPSIETGHPSDDAVDDFYQEGRNLKSIELTTGQYFWVKAPADAVMTVTAESPAA